MLFPCFLSLIAVTKLTLLSASLFAVQTYEGWAKPATRIHSSVYLTILPCGKYLLVILRSREGALVDILLFFEKGK
jgi:hypothetical protein